MKISKNNYLVWILEQSPLARDDRNFAYKMACKKIAEQKGITNKELHTFYSVLQEMPRESDVIRILAYIQNNLWLYKPSEWCKVWRKIKEEKKREDFKRDNSFFSRFIHIFSKND